MNKITSKSPPSRKELPVREKTSRWERDRHQWRAPDKAGQAHALARYTGVTGEGLQPRDHFLRVPARGLQCDCACKDSYYRLE